MGGGGPCVVEYDDRQLDQSGPGTCSSGAL